jgi:GntR family transcriptional regulator, arabinose operon transcriptional repressor
MIQIPSLSADGDIAVSTRNSRKLGKAEIDADEPEQTNGQPKYVRIMESLRADLTSGQYRTGARLPSEAELVRKFGVSRMTVIKAIRQLQQEGLLVRRTGSGTFAASGREEEGRVFGLLIPDLGQTEIFEPICHGMVRTPSAKTHSLLWGHSLATTEHKEEEAESLCWRYIEQKVAGVFFAPVEFSPQREAVNRKILKALDNAGIPVILLDRTGLPYPATSPYDLVGIDNRRAGYIVTDHLLRQGAKQVAFLAREGSAETVDDRIVGYREALLAHGIKRLKNLVVRGDATDTALIKSLVKGQKVDAFVCANDLTAANLMQTLIGLGIRIPDEVRIVGIDDVKYASLLPIPLTTFRQPCSAIGAVSMCAMQERINNPQLPARSILLDGELVVRGSCGSKK